MHEAPDPIRALSPRLRATLRHHVRQIRRLGGQVAIESTVLEVEEEFFDSGLSSYLRGNAAALRRLNALRDEQATRLDAMADILDTA